MTGAERKEIEWAQASLEDALHKLWAAERDVRVCRITLDNRMNEATTRDLPPPSPEGT